ncbi:transposase family protein [Acinetobacter sp. ANC 3903]|uniref:transposase family protein n=1 Tax=Acinetobacter sp. ANC 3903 TaxID=1977883 RepID=UPI00117800A9
MENHPRHEVRGCKLDPELKIYNQEINKRRIGIEHVFGRLKTFKILASLFSVHSVPVKSC